MVGEAKGTFCQKVPELESPNMAEPSRTWPNMVEHGRTWPNHATGHSLSTSTITSPCDRK